MVCKGYLILILFSATSYTEERVCFGSPSNGGLQKDTQLPAGGNNFVGYSFIGRIMGASMFTLRLKILL